MERIAVYPGTFDPITLGHLDVIQASAALFDKVIVGILINTLKGPQFTENERKEMIEDAVADAGLANVEVKIFKGLTVELARHEKATAIIRGLRLTTEYESELNVIFNNRILAPDILSVLIPPRQEHIHISSSVVRELLRFEYLDLDESNIDKYVPLAVLEHTGVMLQRREKMLLESCHRLCGVAGGLILYNSIVNRYLEGRRAYHGIKHISDSLNEFEKVKYLLKNPNEVEIAILSHDAVYDTLAKDNEEKSARLAQKIIEKIGLPGLSGKRVAELILATKHDVPPADFDGKIIVDIDLTSLGYSERDFEKNTAKIRQEYSWVPDGEFYKERVKFFRLMLARPTIYLTEFFQERYERQARQNIARAIAKHSQ